MSDSHGHDSHAGSHAEHPPVPYFVIFGTLVVFTAVTIGASYIELGKAGNVALAFAIAAFKASLVMLFFMHLKYEKRPIVAIALAPFALVGVLILALFPDIAFGQFHSDDVHAAAAVSPAATTPGATTSDTTTPATTGQGTPAAQPSPSVKPESK